MSFVKIKCKAVPKKVAVDLRVFIHGIRIKPKAREKGRAFIVVILPDHAAGKGRDLDFSKATLDHAVDKERDKIFREGPRDHVLLRAEVRTFVVAGVQDPKAGRLVERACTAAVQNLANLK